VQFWETPAGRSVADPVSVPGTISELQFSPDGKWLAIATAARLGEGIVEIVDVASGKVVGRPLIHRDNVMSLAFSRDSHWLATTCKDHSARVWNAATGDPATPSLPQDFEGRQVFFSPDGNRLVTLARRGSVRLWNARTGEAVTAPLLYPRNSGDGCVSYSPDGQRLLIARGGNEAWLLELSPETASLDELKLLAETTSCTRFDPAAGMVPLDESGLNNAWARLRTLRVGN
jgi:WD40 repeat protein